MITLSGLVEKLETLTDYPCTFHSYDSHIEAPFLIVNLPDYNNFFSDDKLYHLTANVDVELYNDIYDITAIKKVMDALNILDIPYALQPHVYIKEEKYHLTVMSFTVEMK